MPPPHRHGVVILHNRDGGFHAARCDSLTPWYGINFRRSVPGSNQTLGIPSGTFAVHSLQSRVVDQSGVDVNLADDVAGRSIGNHYLLRG